jgi:hypothetical protein
MAVLGELHLKLAVATELYEHGGDDGKIGTMRSLNAIIEFCVLMGLPRVALRPLVNVTAALSEAAEGIANPTFAIRKKGHVGQRKTYEERERFGVMAAITECCVRHCQPKGIRFKHDAGKLAANLIKQSALNIVDPPTASQLFKMRERVGEADADSIESITYKKLLNGFSVNDDPLAWAKHILSMPLGKSKQES